MTNMSKTRTPMKEQDSLERSRNFSEVTLGYTLEEAISEAQRCLNCRHRACVTGCPVNVPIPEFITALTQGNVDQAYQIITNENNLPAICGRVCPQESQCELKCVRANTGEAVAIGRLERFVADHASKHSEIPPQAGLNRAIKIAVVGSGPAGLTCAAELALLGYQVTVFEALHAFGGVLTYGIPEFRLPKAIVNAEIDRLKQLGVGFEKNVVIGRSLTISELFEAEDYRAVFIGTGAGAPKFMKIPGENLNGVYSANEFLTRVNLMGAIPQSTSATPIKIGNSVAVVGGGNVAVDAARTALRLGAQEVKIVYRRSMMELPARAEEIAHAVEEGIVFKILNQPIEIVGEKGFVKTLICQQMELGTPDASGRRRPVPVRGEINEISVDTVIIAIGQSPNPLILQTTTGIKATSWGGIIVNEETMETSLAGVYAGGDAVTGAATVISAMGAGKRAAQAINAYLSQA